MVVNVPPPTEMGYAALSMMRFTLRRSMFSFAGYGALAVARVVPGAYRLLQAWRFSQCE